MMKVPHGTVKKFRKSSYSAQETDCMEMAFAGVLGFLRDSKNPDGPELRFDPDSFVTAVKNDQIAPR